MTTNRKTRQTFKESVKKQMVELHKSGSFKEKDNLTPEEKELRELRKLTKELMMENDSLKQAELIFGRK